MTPPFFAPARADGWSRILAFLHATCHPGDLGPEGGRAAFDKDRFVAHPETAALFAITPYLDLLVLRDGTCAMIEEERLLLGDAADAVCTISAPDPVTHLMACCVRRTADNSWPGGIVAKMATADVVPSDGKHKNRMATRKALLEHLEAWSNALDDPFHLYVRGYQGWLKKDEGPIESLLCDALTMIGRGTLTFLISDVDPAKNRPQVFGDPRNPIPTSEAEPITALIKAAFPDVRFVGYQDYLHRDGRRSRVSSIMPEPTEICAASGKPTKSAHERLALRRALMDRYAHQPDVLRAIEALPMA